MTPGILSVPPDAKNGSGGSGRITQRTDVGRFTSIGDAQATRADTRVAVFSPLACERSASLPAMKAGDRVTAPHPLDAVGGVRVEAVFVGVVERPAPDPLEAPPLAPSVLHRVRYDDNTEADWDEGAVIPV